MNRFIAAYFGIFDEKKADSSGRCYFSGTKAEDGSVGEGVSFVVEHRDLYRLGRTREVFEDDD